MKRTQGDRLTTTLNQAEKTLASDASAALTFVLENLKSPDGLDSARAHLIAGEALIKLQRSEEARPYLETAREALKERGGAYAVRLHIALQFLAGLEDMTSGNFGKARLSLEDAVIQCDGKNQVVLLAEALSYLGRVQHQGGDSHAALESFAKVRKIKKGENNFFDEANALSHTALVLTELGDYSNALASLNDALAILEAVNAPASAELRIRSNIGMVLERMNQPETALPHYQRALELAQAQEDQQFVAIATLNIGEAYRLLGQFKEALPLLQQALQLGQQTKSLQVEQGALHSLGLTQLARQDHVGAERYLRASAKLAEESGDVDGHIEALLGLAENLRGMRDEKSALDVLNQALKLTEGHGRKKFALTAHLLIADIVERSSPRLTVRHLRAARTLENSLRSEEGERQSRQLMARIEMTSARRDAEHFRELSEATERARREVAEQNQAYVMELERRALYDDLTGLPNRVLFEDRLRQALDAARREGRPVGLGVIDLDRFKQVNDAFGHATGDRLLREVGTRLAAELREGDTLARADGDQFLLLVLDGAALESVARRMLRALESSFVIRAQDVVLTGSVGLACFPEHGMTADDLRRAAGVALADAKMFGSGVEAYNGGAGDRQNVLARESALYKALDKREFALHYQPLVDAHSGVPVAGEALLRWDSPALGRQLPGDFIPILERSGMIGAVGAWVMEEACRAATAWNGVRVAVNLSARQFSQEGLIVMVERALTRSGLAPELLELEITESLMMHFPERAARTLHDLRDLGVRVMVDDFGTGYSSLSYLERFPLSGVKIDRSFVTRMDGPQRGGAIIRAIVHLSRELGLDVVAEGVETAEQYAALRALGVGTLQGYLFGRPAADWRPQTRPQTEMERHFG